MAIQSVLFGNDPGAILRAAEAAGNSAQRAMAAGLIGDWEYRLGDCSPRPLFSESSADLWRTAVEGFGGEAAYTYFDENLGSAAGHNRVAGESRSDFIIVMNPDIRMSPDTISSLLRAMHPDVGIVEARQLPLDHPKEYEQYTGDTAWASTACAITPRTVFEAVGGFDADAFFLYGDDVDYSWRVRLDGYRVVFEPSARVFHDKRLTIDGDWPTSAAERYYSAEAALMLAQKYSADERVETLLEQFDSSGISFLERAASKFRSRRSAGTLPRQLDPDHRVAKFLGDFYAIHRF
ncbi:glycosyltransferase family 2 protein [Microbacterium lacus]|uniref:glycosyltransferase family 2 protein n=1 Tax=Microbacterium lacus TaxID=415217 RepID=UPI0012FDC250|nr:glycosyltransferase family 2 protein [Microbacterium lacus]